MVESFGQINGTRIFNLAFSEMASFHWLMRVRVVAAPGARSPVVDNGQPSPLTGRR